MNNLTIETISNACGGTIMGESASIDRIRSVEVRGVVTDNRKIKKDYVFIPIVGNRVDGHSFIDQALKDGALFTLAEHEIEGLDQPYILVDSSEIALKKIAAFYRRQLTIPIIGIIGSVGKTSTKEMIASVLGERFRVCKTQGNFNNEIGLPLTILSIQPEDEVAVVEMGISDFGEMHRLGEIAQPDMVVITNIGECHLEFLHDRDGVFRAKTEVFEHLAKEAAVIINTDDDKLAAIDEVPGAVVVRFGTRDQEIRADNISSQGMEGVNARLWIGQDSFEVNIPVPGVHNVYHALAAAAAANRLGMDSEAIRNGISHVESLAGRSRFVHLDNNITVIDDCYNASPISVKAGLDLLSRAENKKIAVLGDMAELGPTEIELHRGVGEHLANLPIDELYTAGDLAKNIGEAAQDSGTGCIIHSFDSREEMTDALLKSLTPDSTILVKASHCMEFPKVVEALEASTI